MKTSLNAYTRRRRINIMESRVSTYGGGSISKKRTNPPYEYVYAEWSVAGKRRSKSCGNAAYPGSWRRARELLRDALRDRIVALEERRASLEESTGRDSGDGPASGPVGSP